MTNVVTSTNTLSFNSTTKLWDVVVDISSSSIRAAHPFVKEVFLDLDTLLAKNVSDTMTTHLNSLLTSDAFYSRIALPEDLKSVPLQADFVSDIAGRFEISGSSYKLKDTEDHKPIDGYWSFRVPSVSVSFHTYDTALAVRTSINALIKSYNDGYPTAADAESISAINAKVTRVYPERTISVDYRTVSGLIAGDTINYQAYGGSGEYTLELSNSNIEEINTFTLLVGSNVTGITTLTLTDTNTNEQSVITFNTVKKEHLV